MSEEEFPRAPESRGENRKIREEGALKNESSLTEPLREVYESIWNRLLEAVKTPPHPWRLPVVATIGSEGPAARTLVLRGVDVSAGLLMFHTDARTPKVQQVSDDNRVTCVFYSAEDQVQAVVRAVAAVHTYSELADQEWDRSPASSRRCYLGKADPGAISEARSVNLPQDLVGRVPGEHELIPGRANFAVLCCEIQSIDWLSLDHSGNTRAAFKCGEVVSGNWLEP